MAEIRTQCKACGGTGIYVGMGERDGAAVVCYKCDGTGCETIKYTPFTKRHRRNDVKRVFAHGSGICIGEGKDGDLSLEDFGGMLYKDWWNGKPFPHGSEDRVHVCPAWWDQSEASKRGIKCPDGLWGRRYSDCGWFGTKDVCWHKWDED